MERTCAVVDLDSLALDVYHPVLLVLGIRPGYEHVAIQVPDASPLKSEVLMTSLLRQLRKPTGPKDATCGIRLAQFVERQRTRRPCQYGK
jgi:hypothetical protein